MRQRLIRDTAKERGRGDLHSEPLGWHAWSAHFIGLLRQLGLSLCCWVSLWLGCTEGYRVLEGSQWRKGVATNNCSTPVKVADFQSPGGHFCSHQHISIALRPCLSPPLAVPVPHSGSVICCYRMGIGGGLVFPPLRVDTWMMGYWA